MSEEVWFGIGALALGVSAIVIAFLGGASNNRAAAKTAIHTTVPLVAAVAYLLLATGYGRFEGDGIGPGFEYARYVDWSITTPLLLVSLLVTAAPLGRNLWAFALAVVFADVVMIGAGAMAAGGPPTVTTAWFLVSTAAFLVVLSLMWGPVRSAAEDGHPIRSETYQRHLTILTVLWAAYPIVFLFGPAGSDVYGPAAATALFMVLDVAAKGGYGILVVLEDHRLAAAENADRRTLAFPSEPAPVPDPDSEDAPEPVPAREGVPEPVARTPEPALRSAAGPLGRTAVAESMMPPGRPSLAERAVRIVRAVPMRSATPEPEPSPRAPMHPVRPSAPEWPEAPRRTRAPRAAAGQHAPPTSCRRRSSPPSSS